MLVDNAAVNMEKNKEEYCVIISCFQFIIALEKLAISARSTSSFTVTFKRWDGHQKPKPREGKPPLPQPKEYLCLMRAQMKSKKVFKYFHLRFLFDSDTIFVYVSK